MVRRADRHQAAPDMKAIRGLNIRVMTITPMISRVKLLISMGLSIKAMTKATDMARELPATSSIL